jgi:hypothetical protein
MGTFLIWYFLGEGLYVYISILELKVVGNEK